MVNKTNLKDLSRSRKEDTISLKVEGGVYKKFKKNLSGIGVMVSDTINEFMKRVNQVFEDGGGEVVFGIELKEGEDKKDS